MNADGGTYEKPGNGYGGGGSGIRGSGSGIKIKEDLGNGTTVESTVFGAGGGGGGGLLSCDRTALGITSDQQGTGGVIAIRWIAT